jgi:hypothetical protein
MLPRVFGRRQVPTDSTLQDTSERKPQKIVEGGKAVASRLLALPGEIRRQIYENVVRGN